MSPAWKLATSRAARAITKTTQEPVRPPARPATSSEPRQFAALSFSFAGMGHLFTMGTSRTFSTQRVVSSSPGASPRERDGHLSQHAIAAEHGPDRTRDTGLESGRLQREANRVGIRPG